MERIVFEVDERIAKAWREASYDKKKDIADKIRVGIGKELFEYDPAGLKVYLDQLRNTMAGRGLTQEILDDILDDEF